MRRNTIYRIRSMTKPFTGTAALMLVEEGDLALDAPVSRWLPRWDNERSGAITVRQFLTDTAGWVQDGRPESVRNYPSLRATGIEPAAFSLGIRSSAPREPRILQARTGSLC